MALLLSKNEVKQAAQMLESGQLVAFPTETVYGLGADADNAVAVGRIFELKSRPKARPLSVHISLQADIHRWACDIPDVAWKIIERFWPGPLTLIFKSQPHVPNSVTGGLNTVGLRCPSHPVAMALLNAFKNGQGGIAAPSANRSGHISPTCASHVIEEFGTDSRLSAIIDAGQSPVGIESTIIDLSQIQHKGIVMLRSGAVRAEEIQALVPNIAFTIESSRIQGQKHYHPHTPVQLCSLSQITELISLKLPQNYRVALLHHSTISAEILQKTYAHVQLSEQMSAYAHDMYAALRMLDTYACDLILIEHVSDDLQWMSVRDRLKQAAEQ